MTMQAGTISSIGHIRMSTRPKNGIRALVADRDPRIREVLARFLSEHGVLVGQTGNEKELLHFLEADRYDLLVLDIASTGEDGISLCRKATAASKVPIILLSGTSEEADCVVGLEAGSRHLTTRSTTGFIETNGFAAAGAGGKYHIWISSGQWVKAVCGSPIGS